MAMGGKIQGINIQIGADTRPLNKALTEIAAQTRNTQKELKQVERALKFNPGNAELIAQQQQLLSNAVAESTTKLSALRQAQEEVQRKFAEGTINEEEYRSFQRELITTESRLNHYRNSLEELNTTTTASERRFRQLGEALNSTGDKFQKVGAKMTSVGKTMTMGVTAPLLAAGVAMAVSASKFEDANAKIQNALGVTAEEAISLKNTAKEVWKDGFGENLDEVSDALIKVKQNMKNVANGDELKRVTADTLLLAKTFDADLNEVTRAGNNLMTNFGISSKEAYDMMAKGAQNGLNFSNELFDNLAEYAPLWSAMGYSAEEMFGILQRGSKEGVYNLDYLNDIMKEFQIRIKDNSKSTSEAMDVMSQSTLDLWEAQYQGKASVADVAQSVIKDLKAMENQVDANEIGVALFGTKWEDLESKAVYAMLGSTEAMTGFEDSMKKISDVQEETFGQRFQSTLRKTQSALLPFGNMMLDLAEKYLPKVSQAIEKMTKKFEGMSPEGKKTTLAIAGITAALPPVILGLGVLASGIGAVMKMMGAASLAMAGTGGAVALLTNPIGWLALGLGAATVAGLGLYAFLKDKGKPEIDLFGESVTDSTQQAVEGFTNLNNEATVQLNQLAWGGKVVTQEMADSITGTFSEMGAQVLAGMQEDHAAQLAQMTSYFQSSSVLTEEQEQEALKSLEEMNAEQIAKHEEGRKRIAEILQLAVDEKRKNTLEEKTQINMIQAEMVEEGIRTLSDGEVEFKTIMERMKSQSAEITAEQAIQTIADARTTKNDVVAEAEKQYADTIALIIRMRDESGEITGEQARQMIAEATKAKDEVVKENETMYSEVLRIAKEKGGEHLTANEIMLGRQLGLWDEWSVDLVKIFTTTYVKANSSFKQMAIDTALSFGKIRSSGTDAFVKLNGAINLATTKIPSYVKTKMAQALAEVIIKVGQFRNAGRDVVQGLINGMKDKLKDIRDTARNIGNTITKTVRNALQVKSPSRVMIGIGRNVSEGLAIGIKDKEKEVVAKAIGVSNALIASAKKVLTSGTKNTNAEISVINKKANEEAKKIEKRAREDVYQIKQKSKAKKKKLTSAELLKIQRLEQDSASKVKKINEKAASDVAKLNSKSSKEKLDALKLFVEEKKHLEQMSLVDEAKVWEASVPLFKNGTKEKIEAQKEYQAALKKVNDEITSTNKEYSDKMMTINEDLKKSEEDLTTKYESTLNDRANSLNSFKGIFDEFTWSIEKTGTELLMNLSSQVEGFVLWQAEMDKFAKKKVDIGLIAELREMGPNALPELLALNSLTEEQLTHYSNLYREKAILARKQAESELVGMKDDTAKQITELRKVANAELDKLSIDWTNKIKTITKASSNELKSLKQIGVDAGKGLLEGLSSMEKPLSDKARQIANTIKSAITSSLQIKSPSRVMMGYGKNIGEGLVVGMNEMNAMVGSAAGNLAKLSTSPFPSDVIYGGNFNGNNNQVQNDRPIVIHSTTNLDGRAVARNQISYIGGMQYDQASIAAVTKGVKPY